MFGVAAEDAIGHELLAFIAPDARDESVSSVAGTYRSFGIRSGGDTFSIEIASTPVRFRGGESRLIAVRDLSPVALVVDDEAPVAHMTANLMCHLGYQAATHISSRAAIADYRPGAASVIVSDVMMPELDGPAMVQTIRSMDPTVPVIFISGFSTAPVAEDAATAFVKKPFGFAELKRAVAGLPERAREALR